MSNNDWNNLGKQVRDIVDQAINSQDFSKLNQTINKTIDQAKSGVESGIKNVRSTVKKSADQTFSSRQYTAPAEKPRTYSTRMKFNQLFARTGGSKAGAIVLMIAGYTFSIGFGIALLIWGLTHTLSGLSLVSSVLNLIGLAFMVPMFIGGIIMAVAGTSM